MQNNINVIYSGLGKRLSNMTEYYHQVLKWETLNETQRLLTIGRYVAIASKALHTGGTQWSYNGIELEWYHAKTQVANQWLFLANLCASGKDYSWYLCFVNSKPTNNGSQTYKDARD